MMKSIKSKVILAGLTVILTIGGPAVAQTVKVADDGTVLKEIIVFGRHGIRNPVDNVATLDQMSADPYPVYSGSTGYLTDNGKQGATILGSYFHDYLIHEGLLTGTAATDLARSYFRANSIERSNMTASKFGDGLIPGATIPVHSYNLGVPDPVFDPILGKVAKVDPARAVTEAQGVYGSGTGLASAYSGEFSLISSVLYPQGTSPTYPAGTAPNFSPATPLPQDSVDPTTQPIEFSANSSTLYTGAVITTGGLDSVTTANDPFVMQYANGLPPANVAWGRMTPDQLSQQTRLTVLLFNIVMRLPYLARVQSSNAAAHILQTLNQAATGDDVRLSGEFGTPRSRVHVIISFNCYVAGVAGLLGVHWVLPGYQPDFCAPGGALVFELRQERKTKHYLVRVYYTAQTFDQLRNLTPLTLDAPPATMQLLVPGGSKSKTDLDVDFMTFKRLMNSVIDLKCVEPYGKETPPGILVNELLD